MTDTNDFETNDVTPEMELEALKQRADLLGISYRANVTEAKLRALIEAKTQDEDAEDEAPKSKREAQVEARQREVQNKRTEATKLVRLKVSCMNPLKREWQGELLTVGNSVLGTFTKFVPFNTEWHVPNIIYQLMKERKFQAFMSVPDGRGGKMRKGYLAKEYSIDLLPDLTPQELRALAQRQAMSNGTQEDNQ